MNSIKTRCVTAFAEEEQSLDVTPAIHMSTSFKVAAKGFGLSGENLTEPAPYFYGRWANPTVRTLERQLASVESAEDSLCFASGMAAISALFFWKLEQGDHLVVSDVCYPGVTELASQILPRYGIEATFVNLSRPENLASALRPNTKIVFAESPCNPIFRLTDIRALAKITHQHGAALIVDSTIATPIATRPIELGADYVVHSLTKFIGGHGDALGGVVVGKKADLMNLRQKMVLHFGGILSPFNAWLISRGLATLPWRMEGHESNAMRVAEFLAQHPRVRRVNYPGLPSHPQHELAKRQMENFSGCLSFVVDDHSRLRERLDKELRVFHYAVSLGKTQSLIFFVSANELATSSYRLDPAQEKEFREWAGEGVFRVSVGLEDADDLIEDLGRSLS